MGKVEKPFAKLNKINLIGIIRYLTHSFTYGQVYTDLCFNLDS